MKDKMDCVIDIGEDLPGSNSSMNNSTIDSKTKSTANSTTNSTTNSTSELTEPKDQQRRSASEALHHGLMRASNFLTEWTPFLLVASYFVFSVSLYAMCTETWIAIFWLVDIKNSMTNADLPGSSISQRISILPEVPYWKHS